MRNAPIFPREYHGSEATGLKQLRLLRQFADEENFAGFEVANRSHDFQFMRFDKVTKH